MKVKIAITICIFAVQSFAAGLKVIGPIDANNGFPKWVMDQNGTMVQIGLDGDGVNGLSIFDPVDPQNPFSVQIGFGAEGFFWTADAAIDFASGGNATLGLALEAAFGAEEPEDGQQFLFTRIRIRFDPPVAGTYVVIHPFGTEIFSNVPAGERFNSTVDIGDFSPFQGVLNGRVSAFLTAVAPAPPAGYLGNPQISQTVTGSPQGANLFMIAGPNGSNLGGPGVNFVHTGLFSVSGKRYELAPGESYCEAPIAGDFNGDCKITLADVAFLAANWTNCNLIPFDACDD